METKQTTFKNLSVLKEAQQSVKSELGDKYETIVANYIQIIEMVMKANSINEFEALKMIKEKTELYKKVDAPLFFASALIEITEGKHFTGFREKVNL
jgi:hypothetical protein